jgi:hypothetical protein
LVVASPASLLPDAPDAIPNGFARFWGPYPKKQGKSAALKAWRQLRPAEADVCLMEQKLATPLDYWPYWAEGKIPDPVNWLKEKRWMDEPAVRTAPLSAKSRQIHDQTEGIRNLIRGVSDVPRLGSGQR